MPTPGAGFEWRLTASGPALVCRPLEPLARHLFTTRTWALGRTREAGDAAWGEVAAAFDMPPTAIARLRQVHGADTVVADSLGAGELPAADIVIGTGSSRVLAVQVADCVPLLMVDRRTGAVAAAHAGWRGLAKGVPARAVEQLRRRFDALPADLLVTAGPSIGACCYEVGADVRERFLEIGFADSSIDRWFLQTASATTVNPVMAGVDPRGRPQHWFFDGWNCTRDQLMAAGVLPENIFLAWLCSASHSDLFCSYRRDGALAGRMAAAIVPARGAN